MGCLPQNTNNVVRVPAVACLNILSFRKFLVGICNKPRYLLLMKWSPALISCLILAPFAISMAEEASEDELLFFGTGVDTPAPPKPPLPAPTETSAPATSDAALKLDAASLGLLLLDAPRQAAVVSRPTVLKASGRQSGTGKPELSFPKGGESMEAALQYAVAAVIQQKTPLPAGLSVKFLLDGDYANHEHDSAGLAAGVLLHSMITGTKVDSKIILCGGLGKAGVVTPANALGLRLRAAPDAGTMTLGVALESEPEVRDLALMGEPSTLLRCEVIGLVTFPDALALASATPPSNLAKARELFQSIRTACAATPVGTFIKNPKVQQKLNEVLTLAPQHLSARLLLQAGTGKLPGRMTYLTSQQAILTATQPFVQALRKQDAAEMRKTATSGGNALSTMQARIHPTVERYLIATRSFMRATNNYLELSTAPQFAGMRQKARDECIKLENDLKAEKVKLETKK